MNTHNSADAFSEEKYNGLAKENLILFGIYSVTRKGEICSFERLVKECFILFPRAFGFARYPEWPDSLKFDRPLRTLRKRGLLVGGSKTLFSLNRFGEDIAKETGEVLTGFSPKAKTTQKPVRGADTALIYSLKESPAFKKFLESKESFSSTEMEIRNLLRCTLETPLRVVKQNLQYSKNLANDYNESNLFAFLEACERILNEKVV